VLRLKQPTDPNAHALAGLPIRGRFFQFSQHRAAKHPTYDDNQNPRTDTRRVARHHDHPFSYDLLDRATKIRTFQQTSFTVTIPWANHHADLPMQGAHTKSLIHSVASQSGGWAARQMKYTYDKGGRL